MELLYILEVCARYQGYEGGALENTMVASVGPRSNTQGNLVERNIAGGEGEAG